MLHRPTPTASIFRNISYRCFPELRPFKLHITGYVKRGPTYAFVAEVERIIRDSTFGIVRLLFHSFIARAIVLHGDNMCCREEWKSDPQRVRVNSMIVKVITPLIICEISIILSKVSHPIANRRSLIKFI